MNDTPASTQALALQDSHFGYLMEAPYVRLLSVPYPSQPSPESFAGFVRELQSLRADVKAIRELLQYPLMASTPCGSPTPDGSGLDSDYRATSQGPRSSRRTPTESVSTLSSEELDSVFPVDYPLVNFRTIGLHDGPQERNGRHRR